MGDGKGLYCSVTGRPTLIRPPESREQTSPWGWKSKKQLTELFARSRRYRFGAVPVSDFVSKRATDRGLHQTLIEAQWFG